MRWFQWGTFCPIYRVHGIGRPFPWQYGDAEPVLHKFDRLRYRLLPYIYSLAGQVTLDRKQSPRPLLQAHESRREATGHRNPAVGDHRSRHRQRTEGNVEGSWDSLRASYCTIHSLLHNLLHKTNLLCPISTETVQSVPT
ncbi:MAG: TIM-barrel domain-containing protein [Silvibacterium sp.]